MKHLWNFKSIVESIGRLGGTIFADDALILHKQKEDNERNIKRKSDDEYKEIGKIPQLITLETSDPCYCPTIRSRDDFSFLCKF